MPGFSYEGTLKFTPVIAGIALPRGSAALEPPAASFFPILAMFVASDVTEKNLNLS
jgi:hypothetical protein